jgi:hypothetical protein
MAPHTLHEVMVGIEMINGISSPFFSSGVPALFEATSSRAAIRYAATAYPSGGLPPFPGNPPEARREEVEKATAS